MSRSTKRSRVAAGDASGDVGACNVSRSCIEAVAETADTNNNIVVPCTTANDFSSDVVANILSYLKLKEIMCKRGVCKKWIEAVRKTPVSPEEIFVVNSVKSYNALTVMSVVLPNLQSVKIMPFTSSNIKYNNGEDPNEQIAARTANWRTHDIEIISAFRKLRRLEVCGLSCLNGRYPFLFNSFPLLQKLSIIIYDGLKCDLGMLAGLPTLKELECSSGYELTGNLRCLRVLKDTLEKVNLGRCPNVKGNFMDLADFSQLKALELRNTDITADIQDISNNDFPKLEELVLGRDQSVNGNIRSLRVLKDSLQKLVLNDCPNVEGNFTALADFPLLRSLHLFGTAATVDTQDISNGDFARLEELVCGNSLVSGNIRNLRVLKDTLTNVTFRHCLNVEGNFMDLADFPQLRTLDLEYTAVTGDIRDIGKDAFLNLEQLTLPSTIYGGFGYELLRISDAPELMRALYLLKKEHPSLIVNDWLGYLSQDSPDWYEWDEEIDIGEASISPPFLISLVEAGPRIGYRWKCDLELQHCEVNWLDPLPDEESSEEFLEKIQQIENEQGVVYKGYHQPPSRDEYIRLVEEWSLKRESGLL
jgi:hypothetical protein